MSSERNLSWKWSLKVPLESVFPILPIGEALTRFSMYLLTGYTRIMCKIEQLFQLKKRFTQVDTFIRRCSGMSQLDVVQGTTSAMQYESHTTPINLGSRSEQVKKLLGATSWYSQGSHRALRSGCAEFNSRLCHVRC